MKVWNYALRRRKIYCRAQYRNREQGTGKDEMNLLGQNTSVFCCVLPCFDMFQSAMKSVIRLIRFLLFLLATFPAPS
jgi:hypothetical protein